MHYVSILICFLLLPVLTVADTTSTRVGVILPLSGDFAAYGRLVREGIMKADREGIELIFEDERCDAKGAVTALKKLQTIDKVKYILGPCCGSPQRAVAPLVKNRDQLLMLTSSATEDLYELSGGKIFSAQYSIESEASFIAEEFNQRKLQKAVLVYYENVFSRAHEEAFKKAFKGKVVSIFSFPSFDMSHVKAAAIKLKTLEFDSIFIPDATPMLMGFLTELNKVGVGVPPVFSVYSVQMDDVLKIEGKNVEGLVYSYPNVSGDAISYFPKKGAEILFEAVRECGEKTSCVQAYLKAGYDFDKKNVLKSELIFKTVKNGRFVVLD